MNRVNILAPMRHSIIALAGLALLLNAGCQSIFFCNGTGEPVTFRFTETDVSGQVLTRSVTVDACDCMQYQFFVFNELDFINLLDFNEDPLYSHPLLFLRPDKYVTFDGFDIEDLTTTPPDLDSKRTLTLRNESGESVHIRPDSNFLQTPPSTLIPPQGTLDFTTIRTEPATFRLFDSSGASTEHTCEIELLEGNEIIWDGTELRCTGGSGGGMASIDICNTDNQQNAPSVIFVLQGQDPLVDGVFVIANQCEVLEVHSGAPATISVFDNEGVLELGTCTINDPTDGDSATWDGTEVTCQDQ